MNEPYLALDDDLGPVRLCPGCREWWPDDAEFYGGGPFCLACEDEQAAIRRDQIARAARRYRARVRAEAATA